MESRLVVQEFEKSWTFARQMTHDFIVLVPDDKWEYSPHPRYAPLCKQFRHMIWVTGLYREALQCGNMKSCAAKQTHYTGDLTRKNIVAGLLQQDGLFRGLIERFKNDGIDGYKIGALGTVMGFSEFSHVILHHESNHHGLWSMYAAFGEFATPQSWKAAWEL